MGFLDPARDAKAKIDAGRKRKTFEEKLERARQDPSRRGRSPSSWRTR
jgi:hypothetical protein